jgi:hypothetical protein
MKLGIIFQHALTVINDLSRRDSLESVSSCRSHELDVYAVTFYINVTSTTDVHRNNIPNTTQETMEYSKHGVWIKNDLVLSNLYKINNNWN